MISPCRRPRSGAGRSLRDCGLGKGEAGPDLGLCPRSTALGWNGAARCGLPLRPDWKQEHVHNILPGPAASAGRRLQGYAKLYDPGPTAPSSSARRHAGRICGVTSTTNGTRRNPPSRARRWIAFVRSTTSRARSTGSPPRSALPRARGTARRRSTPSWPGPKPSSRGSPQGRSRPHIRYGWSAASFSLFLTDGRVGIDKNQPSAPCARSASAGRTGSSPIRHRRRNARPRHDDHRDRQAERARSAGLSPTFSTASTIIDQPLDELLPWN